MDVNDLPDRLAELLGIAELCDSYEVVVGAAWVDRDGFVVEVTDTHAAPQVDAAGPWARGPYKP